MGRLDLSPSDRRAAKGYGDIYAHTGRGCLVLSIISVSSGLLGGSVVVLYAILFGPSLRLFTIALPVAFIVFLAALAVSIRVLIRRLTPRAALHIGCCPDCGYRLSLPHVQLMTCPECGWQRAVELE